MPADKESPVGSSVRGQIGSIRGKVSSRPVLPEDRPAKPWESDEELSPYQLGLQSATRPANRFAPNQSLPLRCSRRAQADLTRKIHASTPYSGMPDRVPWDQR